jgi:hypothetical protein
MLLSGGEKRVLNAKAGCRSRTFSEAGMRSLKSALQAIGNLTSQALGYNCRGSLSQNRMVEIAYWEYLR